MHVNLILILMALCVVGIIGLQLFWNYQNYKSTRHTFRQAMNQTLKTAVNLERAQRHQQLINQVKEWLADTSFISITCDTKNLDSNTVFHINDRYPKVGGSQGISFGFGDFKPKLNRMAPEVKKKVIDRFTDTRVRQDLREGMVYYYTQRLGDRLRIAVDESHLQLAALDSIYKKQLRANDIPASFQLNPVDTSGRVYLTQRISASLLRPNEKEWVRASFESPDRYFLKTMKWVIISTLLLVSISLLCFGYTANTLLSQRKLVQLKDDFINNMTHELNTPLASIKITAEALKTFAYNPAIQRNYLDIICYQTDKLTDLTAKILTTNRLAVVHKDDWEALDLNALVNQAIVDLTSQVQRQQALVLWQTEAEPLQVYGRSSSLVTAFTNLIDNALKYGSSTLTIKLSGHRSWAAIDFADNGIGIPEEYRSKLFEPFFRVPQGNVHDRKGYGLGLSYVHQVVVQHGGMITVEANQPCGSLFRIKLPRTA